MIIELFPDAYPTVSPLFAEVDHNAALVYSVLEGSSPGRVFTDCAPHPTWALAAVIGAFSYLGGEPDDAHALVERLFTGLLPESLEKELVLFAFKEGARARIEPALHERGAITIHRKVFDFNPVRFAALDGWRWKIPPGIELRVIDAELAARNPAFLPLVDPRTRRFGVCLLKDAQVVSSCTAVAVGRREAEIDIFTAEACRGQGLAALAACAFIEECLSRGLRPAWSCWPARQASIALAKKLGFDEMPDVPAFYWAENM